ncbi:MAG TPA: hypothetical protein VFW45_02340, partial [Candidatus Polarisedimenticolia bacterium]|nr:hypothetical protein [Candidatus Polarisedimenticolia bacterium]
MGQGKPASRKKTPRTGPAPGLAAKGIISQEVRQTSEKSRLAWGIAAALVLAFLAQGLGFLRANSQTSDEAVHLSAGYSYLERADFRLNPEHPPLIKELCALSVLLSYGLPFQPNERLWQASEEWRIGRDFLYRAPVSWESILFAARLPNLFLGVLLV